MDFESEHSRHNGPASNERVFERTREVKKRAAGLASATGEAVSEWQRFLHDRLEKNPYATLGTFAGIGYVLSGGLSPHVVRLAFGIGSRIVLAMVLKEVSETIAGRSELAGDQTKGKV